MKYYLIIGAIITVLAAIEHYNKVGRFDRSHILPAIVTFLFWPGILLAFIDANVRK